LPVNALPSTTRAWLDPNFELIEAVAHTGNGVADLWDASPVRLDSNEPKTEEIIDSLFPRNPLLCCAWTRNRFDTRPRNRWYKLHDLQFIVPNPMAALRGLTRNGKISAHALSNTGPRRFLIVEFDFDAPIQPKKRSCSEDWQQKDATGAIYARRCYCILQKRHRLHSPFNRSRRFFNP
jgi:hypothetical protein